MTDAARIKLARKLGLILAVRPGHRALYLVDDKPAQRFDHPGHRLHYPPEPPRLVPKEPQ